MMPGLRFRLAEFFIVKRYRRNGRRVLGDQASLQEQAGSSGEIVYAFDADRGRADDSSRPLA